MKDLRRIQITHVHKTDGFYLIKDKFIGQTGMFNLSRNTKPGYYSGDFYPDSKEETQTFFLAIRYHRV